MNVNECYIWIQGEIQNLEVFPSQLPQLYTDILFLLNFTNKIARLPGNWFISLP